VGARQEVVAERAPGYIIDWVVVAFVNDEAGPSIEGPEADRFIGRGREEVPCGCRGGGVWRGDGGRERDGVDRARVPD